MLSDMYSMELNRRMQLMQQAGLRVAGARLPYHQHPWMESTEDFMDRPTNVIDGPFSSGPTQGLSHAKPVRTK